MNFTFLKNDIRNIFREGIMVILLPMALLLAIALRFGFAPLAAALSPWVDLKTYSPLVLMFIMNMGPLLTGMIGGLLLVDEADNHILPALAVTPPGKRGFLLNRLLTPYLWTIAILLPVPAVSGLGSALPFPLYGLLVFIISLGAPLEAMIIGVLTKNKIEAMAVGKMTGILFVAPFIAWFVPGGLKYLGSPLPGFWLALVYFEKAGAWSPLFLLPPLMLSGGAIYMLLRIFDRRIS